MGGAVLLHRSRSAGRGSHTAEVVVDAARWWSLDEDAARAVAASIAADVGGKVIGVRSREYMGRRRRVALFEVRGQRFAFVPGGEVSVGYDGGRFVARQNSWRAMPTRPRRNASASTSKNSLSSMTSPPRAAVVPPLLVAVAAVEAGAVPVAPDHPRIAEQLATARGQGVTYLDSEPGRRIEWSHQARVILGRNETVTAAGDRRSVAAGRG